MREAAERNRRAVRGDYGVAEPSAPVKAPWEGPLDGPQVSPPLSRDPSPSPRQPSGGAGAVDPSAEERYWFPCTPGTSVKCPQLPRVLMKSRPFLLPCNKFLLLSPNGCLSPGEPLNVLHLGLELSVGH